MVLHTYESRLFGAGEEIDNARERYIKKKKKKKNEKTGKKRMENSSCACKMYSHG